MLKAHFTHTICYFQFGFLSLWQEATGSRRCFLMIAFEAMSYFQTRWCLSVFSLLSKLLQTEILLFYNFWVHIEFFTFISYFDTDFFPITLSCFTPHNLFFLTCTELVFGVYSMTFHTSVMQSSLGFFSLLHNVLYNFFFLNKCGLLIWKHCVICHADSFKYGMIEKFACYWNPLNSGNSGVLTSMM